MEQTAVRKKKYYVKKKPQSFKYRKPQQRKPVILSPDEKVLLKHIKNCLHERMFQIRRVDNRKWIAVHAKNYLGPQLGWTPSKARHVLLLLKKNKIIKMRHAWDKPSWEYLIRFVQRKS